MINLSKKEVILSQWIKEFTEGRETGIPVPCDECHACCTNLHAQLYPNELKLRYEKKYNRSQGKYHLKHKPNGECIYLTEVGCKIHQRVPKVCRTFDCRFLGYFNIRDPKHEGINNASKRWIFIIDNEEMHEYCRRVFKLRVSLLPVKSGDPVDKAGKDSIYATYENFFTRRSI